MHPGRAEDASLGLAVYLNATRLRLRPRRNGDLQHTGLAGGGDGLRVRGGGQYEAAVKGASRTFTALVAAVLPVLLLTVAAQREHAVLHRDLDVLRIDARDNEKKHEANKHNQDNHQRHPVTGDGGAGLVTTPFAHAGVE